MKSNIAKTFAGTFIYSMKDESGHDTESALLDFILNASRVNKKSDAFAEIINQVKVRQTTAVLLRVLMLDNVVLCIGTKELPASFKVFEAKDVKSINKAKTLFIDVTGLIKLQNGYFACKEIDKLCAYLMAATVTLVYNDNTLRITTNASIVKESTICFMKLFCAVLDNLRVINFDENRNKIAYIVAVYFLYNMVGKDIKLARVSAANLSPADPRECPAYDLYYNENTDMENIDTFVKFLAETFKLKGLTTDVFISRWIMLYGTGTMYGTELLPNFLTIITNAYSGSYINRQKMIENICGKDMVDLSTTLLRVGADVYDKGFTYTAVGKTDLADLKKYPTDATY